MPTTSQPLVFLEDIVKNLIRFTVALTGMAALVGVAMLTPVRPAAVQYFAQFVDATASPSSSASALPTLAPTVGAAGQSNPNPSPDLSSPTAIDGNTGNEPFPQQPAPVVVAAPVAATPAPVFVPTAMVSMGIQDAGTSTFDVNTGGRLCVGPCTITWIAYFQGGFPGVAPAFTWSDGHVGVTDVVIYSASGVYPINVIVQETVNGHTYGMATTRTNGPEVTVQ